MTKGIEMPPYMLVDVKRVMESTWGPEFDPSRWPSEATAALERPERRGAKLPALRALLRRPFRLGARHQQSAPAA